MANGDLTIGDLKVKPVEARLNAVPMMQCNEVLVIAALTKTIKDCFIYYNTSCDDALVDMVVSDIEDMYSRFSVLEMVKALIEGRRYGGDLYGRLSAKHIMEWIAVYERQTMERLAEYRRNERFKVENEWDGVELPYDFTKGLNQIESEEKREHTHEEKMAQLLSERITEEERERRDYMNNWDYDKSGMTLEKWMQDFDHRNKVD